VFAVVFGGADVGVDKEEEEDDEVDIVKPPFNGSADKLRPKRSNAYNGSFK